MSFKIVHQLFDKVHKNKFLNDSFWALLGSALGKALSLLAGIIVARLLGKEVYGQYGLLKSTLINISIFSTLGLGYTGTRFVAKNIDNGVSEIIRNIYRIALAFSFLVAILVFAFATPISVFIKAPEMNNALRFTAFIIVINAVNSTQIGILSGFKAFKQIARNNVYAGCVTFILSALFTYLWGFEGALYALFASFLFNVLINSNSVRKLIRLCHDYKVEKHIRIKELIFFSLPIALQESMYTIVGFLSSYLLIRYADYGELGITSAASQWSAVILFIPGVMKNVMLSYFSSSESTKSLRKRMICINSLSTFIPWLLIVVLSNFIVSFYGRTFNNLNIVIIISCSSAIFSSISSVIVYEFISLGKVWTMFFLRLLRDTSSVLLLWYMLTTISSIQGSVISASINSFNALIFMILLLIIQKRLDTSIESDVETIS